MKYVISTLVLFILSINIKAQTLTELPFGIVIGKTANIEIQNKGICKEEIEVSENKTRCLWYEMAGGKFFVYSSQNEIVSKLYFKGSIGPLPKKWRGLGLKFMIPYKENGTQEDEFIKIIQSEGAENIKTSVSNEIAEITFEIGNNLYQANIQKDYISSLPRKEDENDKFGLIEISITELY